MRLEQGSGGCPGGSSPPPVTMETPQRIQLHRTKGWRKPEGAIVVARPSRWGNPYSVDGEIVFDRNDNAWMSTNARQLSIDLFREHAINHPARNEWIAPLAGHDLACWCPLDQPCHADVLLELANR